MIPLVVEDTLVTNWGDRKLKIVFDLQIVGKSGKYLAKL